ncbi:NAD(P)/FAD-dependent oxidoreductase [Salinifilum aidingensis]
MAAADYDTVVIGGGAAGLSAATVLGRSRRRVLLVDDGAPRNAPAEHLHGFLSRDGESPRELGAVGREEVRRYGGELCGERVDTVEQGAESGFVVHLAGGRAVTSRTVLVATGLVDELPDVPGVRERWGLDVLHCPYCHGHEVRDSAFAVLGGENRPFTLHQAHLVRQWSEDVVFFPGGIALEESERERLQARGVRIVDGEVARVRAGGSGVSGVELADGQVFAREVVFVGPRFVPRDDLLRKLGCALGDDGWVSADPAGRTNVPGVWAAGNVVDNPAQLINAASAGTTAGIGLNHELLAADVDRAVAAQRSAGASVPDGG